MADKNLKERKIKAMRECYIKTKNNLYLISESKTLVIERGKINKYVSPFKSVKNATEYIKRCKYKPHMKKFLPLKIELKK